ncbi:hypothetical protein HN51_012630, partial [Arachis hypogaea]
ACFTEVTVVTASHGSRARRRATAVAPPQSRRELRSENASLSHGSSHRRRAITAAVENCEGALVVSHRLTLTLPVACSALK